MIRTELATALKTYLCMVFNFFFFYCIKSTSHLLQQCWPPPVGYFERFPGLSPHSLGSPRPHPRLSLDSPGLLHLKKTHTQFNKNTLHNTLFIDQKLEGAIPSCAFWASMDSVAMWLTDYFQSSFIFYQFSQWMSHCGAECGTKCLWQQMLVLAAFFSVNEIAQNVKREAFIVHNQACSL